MLYILPGLVLTACERVTAPKALEIADKLEENLSRHWTPGLIISTFGDTGPLDAWFSSRDRSTIFVGMDGPMEQMGAIVLERMYFPPSGYGAPFSRRSLLAFPLNADYGILARTETNASEGKGLNGFDKWDKPDDLNPQAYLAVSNKRQEDWWTPRSGNVVVEPVETGTKCPLELDQGNTEQGRVSCDLVTYDVHLQWEFVRRGDAASSLLESIKPRTTSTRHRSA